MRFNLRKHFFGVAALLICTGSAPSQDVKPPAASKPVSPRDISGVWMGLRIGPTTADKPSFLPWAEAVFKAYQSLGDQRPQHDARRDCFPLGMPRNQLEPVPIEILQTSDRVLMFMENDHMMRQIFMDLPEHPKDINLTWMGHSIGKWDGDTLVVDTTRLRAETFIDGSGLPHTDALHIVERLRRVDADTLEDDLTIDDPKTYTKPWNMTKVYKLKPGWHVMEYVCEDEWTDKLKKYFSDTDRH